MKTATECRSPLVSSSFFLTCLLLALFSGTVAAADFTAKVDRSRLSLNETLTLTLTYEGQTINDPDLSGLEADFEILAQQRHSQLAFGFGQDNSTTNWIVSLAPKSTGDLDVPAISFKGSSSEPIAVTVHEPRENPAASENIFLETTVDTDEAYIQSEVLLTLRLHTAVMLGSVDFPELSIPDTRTLKVHDTQYRKNIDGREFIVVELKYVLFPEKAGTLTIPSITIDGVVTSGTDPFGGSSLFGPRGKPLRLRSEEKQLRVLPIPDAAGAGPWVPAEDLSISQRWSREPGELKVGEPITRTITVTAQGLTGAQIPPLETSGDDAYKLYPDQPEIRENLTEDGVIGVRRESAALVPTEPGTLTLPPITVTWWDTTQDRLQHTTLASETLQVLPAAEAAGNTAGPGDIAAAPGAEAGPASGIEGRWFYLSLALNAALLLALLLLLILRPATTRPPETAAAEDGEPVDEEAERFQALLATPDNRQAQLRENIIRWGQLFWPEYRISTLADVAKLSNDETLSELFARMDKSLYGNDADSAVDAAAIKRTVKGIRKRWKADGIKPDVLKPLYPTG